MYGDPLLQRGIAVLAPNRLKEYPALPTVGEQGAPPQHFEVWGGGFIATGHDADEVARQMEWCRYRIAFYGSTRSYQPVLTLHGWDDLAARLHEMSKRGQWNEMAKQVPDDVLHAIFSRFCIGK